MNEPDRIDLNNKDRSSEYEIKRLLAFFIKGFLPPLVLAFLTLVIFRHFYWRSLASFYGFIFFFAFNPARFFTVKCHTGPWDVKAYIDTNKRKLITPQFKKGIPLHDIRMSIEKTLIGIKVLVFKYKKEVVWIVDEDCTENKISLRALHLKILNVRDHVNHE